MQAVADGDGIGKREGLYVMRAEEFFFHWNRGSIFTFDSKQIFHSLAMNDFDVSIHLAPSLMLLSPYIFNPPKDISQSAQVILSMSAQTSNRIRLSSEKGKGKLKLTAAEFDCVFDILFCPPDFTPPFFEGLRLALTSYSSTFLHINTYFVHFSEKFSLVLQSFNSLIL
jgi:hypothetical protein